MKNIEHLKVGAIYETSLRAIYRYAGKGSLESINARSGDPRLVTCGFVDTHLLESLVTSCMTEEEFLAKRNDSTRAVSEFYESTGLNP